MAKLVRWIVVRRIMAWWQVTKIDNGLKSSIVSPEFSFWMGSCSIMHETELVKEPKLRILFVKSKLLSIVTSSFKFLILKIRCPIQDSRISFKHRRIIITVSLDDFMQHVITCDSVWRCPSYQPPGLCIHLIQILNFWWVQNFTEVTSDLRG